MRLCDEIWREMTTALCLLSFLAAAPQAQDLRSAYDVATYRLDLQVHPEQSKLAGSVAVVAKVTAGPLATFELDLRQGRRVLFVREVAEEVTQRSPLTGTDLKFTHEGDRIAATLSKPAAAGQELRIVVGYELTAAPNERGIRFNKTPDGKPWIGTSCQVAGAHSWWPCKGENEHPEDKFDRLMMNVTVPRGLYAVANGKLLERVLEPGNRETFRWRHDYPCHNYAVTLNVAPYVEVKSELTLPGLEKPVPFHYYVLPQDLEKAKLQFTDVQPMLAAFSEAFGPWPFPDSKFALVQTDFWGMEHSTAVAYGNSFPKWIQRNGGNDPWRARNVYFDYILIHEVAHEWWANAVSAKDWGHLWIHEGFGTYAEGVYVEKTMGRDTADTYFSTLRWRIDPNFTLFRGKGALPSQAFNNNVYYKGAWVLNTLRYFVNDDAAWWRSLREFNLRFRYKNAVTEDFQAVLEEITGKKWDRFFQEWFYGAGHPLLEGRVFVEGNKIVVDVESSTRDGRSFHLPLEVGWREGDQNKAQRFELRPGANRFEIACNAPPTAPRLLNTQRFLADVRVRVE
jgi:aminopeptidase N